MAHYQLDVDDDKFGEGLAHAMRVLAALEHDLKSGGAEVGRVIATHITVDGAINLERLAALLICFATVATCAINEAVKEGCDRREVTEAIERAFEQHRASQQPPDAPDTVG